MPKGNVACPSEVIRAMNGVDITSWGSDMPLKLKTALLYIKEADSFVVLAPCKSTNINDILKTCLKKRASFTHKEYYPRPL